MKLKSTFTIGLILYSMTYCMAQENKRVAAKQASGTKRAENSDPQQISPNGRIAVSKSSSKHPVDKGKTKTTIAADGRSAVTTREK